MTWLYQPQTPDIMYGARIFRRCLWVTYENCITEVLGLRDSSGPTQYSAVSHHTRMFYTIRGGRGTCTDDKRKPRNYPGRPYIIRASLPSYEVSAHRIQRQSPMQQSPHHTQQPLHHTEQRRHHTQKWSHRRAHLEDEA